MLDNYTTACQNSEGFASLAAPGIPDRPAEQTPDTDRDQERAPVRQLINVLAWALERELQTLEQGRHSAVERRDLATAVVNLKQASQIHSIHCSVKKLQYEWEELQL